MDSFTVSYPKGFEDMRSMVDWQNTLRHRSRSLREKRPRMEDWVLEVSAIIYFFINPFFPFARAKTSHLMSPEIEGGLECLAL